MIPNASHHTPRTRPVTEADLELNAYNAAFDELELDWHWTPAEMRDLAGIGCEKERICTYLRLHRPHLLKVYDAEALAGEIVDVKDRLRARASRLGNG